MHQIDLTRADLNLLVVFEALFPDRHVGLAAKQLFLPQLATSHALGRLRELFNDPLFVRNPRGIEPTPRGRELAQPVADALAQIRGFLSPAAPFDAAKLQRAFKIAAHDYAMTVLVAPLVAILRAEAPGVDLRCVRIPPANVIDTPDHGELDCALGGFHGIAAERVTRTALFSDRFVGVARRDHPSLRRGRMTLEDFVATPQVLVSAGGEVRGGIDEAPASAGYQRRVALSTPSFLALPLIVETTDLVGVLPERLALRLSAATPLNAFELPIDVEPMTCSMLALAPIASSRKCCGSSIESALLSACHAPPLPGKDCKNQGLRVPACKPSQRAAMCNCTSDNLALISSGFSDAQLRI
jgi:DNA-binding transcriptional LysR family regulator